MKLGVVICFMAALMAAQEQSPSLGDVAKQKSTKKATRVITNDEIPSKPAEPPAAEVKPEPAKTDAAEADKRNAEPGALKQPEGDPDLPEPVRAAEKNLGAVRSQHAKAVADVQDLQGRVAEATDSNVKEALNAQLEDKKQIESELKKKVAEANDQVTAARKAAGLPTGPQY